MARNSFGPRRTDSPRAYIRATRTIGALSVLLLCGAIAWDLADDRFWSRHALFTSLLASLIVVAVTAAVLNEVLERRQRERWSVLAQYALFDLIRAARRVWSGLLELAGLAPDGELGEAALTAGSEAVHDTPRLAAAIDQMLSSAERREQLEPAKTEPRQPGDSDVRADRGRVAPREPRSCRPAGRRTRSRLLRTRDADRPARLVGCTAARPPVRG